MRLRAVSPPISCIAFLGLRTTAQMSVAARLTAGTTLFLTLGMKRITPTSAAMIAMVSRVVLLDESLLLPVSTAVAVIAAALRNRIIWIAPATPVLSTIALAGD